MSERKPVVDLRDAIGDGLGGGSADMTASPASRTPAPAGVGAVASASVSTGTLKRIRRDLLMAARQLAAARALVAERESEWAQARAGAESAGLPADMCGRMVTAAWTGADMDLPVDA
jgi:hypothetical protein